MLLKALGHLRNEEDEGGLSFDEDREILNGIAFAKQLSLDRESPLWAPRACSCQLRARTRR